MFRKVSKKYWKRCVCPTSVAVIVVAEKKTEEKEDLIERK
jgi:hypothetical protein